MIFIVYIVFTLIALIPAALIREKLYFKDHRDSVNLKARNAVLWTLRGIIILIMAIIGWFVYVTDVHKTEIVRYTNENHQLIVYQIGEPGFPFGNATCQLRLLTEGKTDDEMTITIANDGKAIDADNFDAVWNSDGVSITACGEEQEDKTYVLYFVSPELHQLNSPQVLKANFIEFGRDCLTVKVTDPMDNTVFPKSAEITILLNEDSALIDLDGTVIRYGSGNNVSKKLKWVEGMVLQIEFTAHTDYVADNGFRNRAAGKTIENIDVIVTDAD